MKLPAQLTPTALNATQQPRLMVVMGVCGCGKSTIAAQLAAALNGIYLDGDDYHPQTNIAKMKRGDALTDKDRWPWLQHFALSIKQQAGVTVGACSALRRCYRDYLTEVADEQILFIYLEGSKALISQRMQQREGHFMPDKLLDSQLATLERPKADEHALSVAISGTTTEVTEAILSAFKHHY